MVRGAVRSDAPRWRPGPTGKAEQRSTPPTAGDVLRCLFALLPGCLLDRPDAGYQFPTFWTATTTAGVLRWHPGHFCPAFGLVTVPTETSDHFVNM